MNQMLLNAGAQRLARWLIIGWLCGLSGLALAQADGVKGAVLGEQEVSEWLDRVHAAPRRHNYTGTIVVSSNAGAMSSARIWHACDEHERQVERIEALSGLRRSTLRRDDHVVTFLPEQKLVRIEQHESLARFPELLRSGGPALSTFYSARALGVDRVAGFETDVVALAPADPLRFGYRVWTERSSGLVVKRQTLAPDETVLEQTAFSELQLDVPVLADRLVKMMTPPAGWRVERSKGIRTTAAAEGWKLEPAIPGFRPIACYRRGAGQGSMQCVFSDGLASVSLFVEPLAGQDSDQRGVLSAGATHTLTQQLEGWRVTAVGEVPPQTLRRFMQSLERRP